MGEEELKKITGEEDLGLVHGPTQRAACNLAAPESPAHEIADTDEMLRAHSYAKRPYQTVLKQNLQLLRVCSLLEDKVLRLEESLKRASRRADYDALTGLPNRRLLLERFRLASALGKRHGQQLALLFLDLDDFKRVNDQQGHEAGDKLLQQVATRLSSCIRASDTACRYGGDEFVVLLTEIDSRDGALTEVTRVLAHLAAPYLIDGASFRVTASIGIAIYPDDGVDYADLIRHSDQSMFRNKANGAHRQPPDTVTPKFQT